MTVITIKKENDKFIFSRRKTSVNVLVLKEQREIEKDWGPRVQERNIVFHFLPTRLQVNFFFFHVIFLNRLQWSIKFLMF